MNDATRTEAEGLVRRMLELIGEDPDRDGLVDTPERVVRSWGELFGGYRKDCKNMVKVFEQECDQIVMLRNVDYFSFCEHHILPFFGKCHIAYIPKDNRVLGVSKLVRMLDVFARRLQLQERLTTQLAEGIQEAINPLGVAVYLDGQHLCMTMRGVGQMHSTMRTHKLMGLFLESGSARAELMSLMQLNGN